MLGGIKLAGAIERQALRITVTHRVNVRILRKWVAGHRQAIKRNPQNLTGGGAGILCQVLYEGVASGDVEQPVRTDLDAPGIVMYVGAGNIDQDFIFGSSVAAHQQARNPASYAAWIIRSPIAIKDIEEAIGREPAVNIQAEHAGFATRNNAGEIERGLCDQRAILNHA